MEPTMQDWLLKRQAMQQQKELHPIEVIRQELYNKHLQEALSQSRAMNPIQQQGAQLALGEAQKQAPLRDFLARVGSMGSPREAVMSQFRQDPEGYKAMWGDIAQEQEHSVPMQGATQSSPMEHALQGASEMYNAGPQVRQNITQAMGILPAQLELLKTQQAGQMGIQALANQGHREAALASRQPTIDHYRDQSRGMVMKEFLGSPAITSGIPAFIEAAKQDVKEDQANVLVRQGHALRAQITTSGQNAMLLADTFNVPEIKPQLQAMMNQQLSQLDDAMRTMYDRYWGPKVEKKSSTEKTIESLVPSGSYDISGVHP